MGLSIMNKKSYICYLDDNDQKVDGFVEILDSNSAFVKFSTNKNVLTIPFNRVIKIKEVRADDSQ